MKRFLACLALCASLSAYAQVVYPYNPDANGDSAITSGDLLDFLPVFATTFTPEGITIDGVLLDEWLSDLEAVVISNAASIESLFAMQSQINELETANDNLQSQINSLQNQLNNLTFNVDGFPPCTDIDNDGICDFADACPPTFVYGLEMNDFGEDVYLEMLIAGGVYSAVQLDGADLSYACLPKITLEYFFFFTGVNLTGANLTGAKLIGGHFTDANLFGANLGDADLEGADFSNVDLTSANLTWANLEFAEFSNVDLTSANLQAARLSYSSFTGANLTGANLALTNLRGANLSGVNLTDADLSFTELFDAYLTGADLSATDLSDAYLTGATMTCLISCPAALPTGYTCEPDPDCSEPNRYRIVPE
ncbi:pentapeptide repeat-containing protein [Flavobacteriales bacterium]|nr:pentapeptide repeat-containing protein [Flavobacteriales bacterium]